MSSLLRNVSFFFSSCFEPLAGLTGDQILNNTQGTLKTGLVSVVQTSSTNTKGVQTVSNCTNAAFQNTAECSPQLPLRRAMGTRKKRERQQNLWIATSAVVQSPGHAFTTD